MRSHIDAAMVNNKKKNPELFLCMLKILHHPIMESIADNE